MKILVLLAFDGNDAAVLRAVAAIGARTAASVVLAHAVAPAASVEEARAALERHAAALAPLAVSVEARVAQVDALASARIDADAPDLLVIGRSAARAGGSGWGDHGRVLLRLGRCPLLVVPAGAADETPTRALVGMDLSDAAFEALALAVRLCPSVEALAVLAPAEAEAEGVRAALAAAYADGLARRGLVPARLRMVPADAPADALLAAEAEVDLVAVGSRGLSAVASMFLGSTAERLAGAAVGPVLVVGRRGEPRSLLTALLDD